MMGVSSTHDPSGGLGHGMAILYLAPIGAVIGAIVGVFVARAVWKKLRSK